MLDNVLVHFSNIWLITVFISSHIFPKKFFTLLFIFIKSLLLKLRRTRNLEFKICWITLLTLKVRLDLLFLKIFFFIWRWSYHLIVIIRSSMLYHFIYWLNIVFIIKYSLSLVIILCVGFISFESSFCFVGKCRTQIRCFTRRVFTRCRFYSRTFLKWYLNFRNNIFIWSLYL